jgi:hypothetical protein
VGGVLAVAEGLSGHSVVGLNDEKANAVKEANGSMKPIRVFHGIRRFVAQAND